MNFTDATAAIADVGGSSKIHHLAAKFGSFGRVPAARPSSTGEIKGALKTLGLLNGDEASPLDLGNEVLKAGNFASKVIPASINYSIEAEDGVVVATPGVNDITVTLPSPTNGRVLTVKRTGSGSGKALVSGNGIEIDGSTASRELTAFMNLSVMGFNDEWYIV